MWTTLLMRILIVYSFTLRSNTLGLIEYGGLPIQLQAQSNMKQLRNLDGSQIPFSVGLLSGSHSNSSDTTGEEPLEVMEERQFHSPISSHLNVIMRLRKLDHYFSTLRIHNEDCRLRFLCEIAKDPAKFSPLAIAFLDETRFIGDEKFLASRLLQSEIGTKLLTYIEATIRGGKRNTCDIYVYRCPQRTESMINYEQLLVWREMSKWLTVKMVSTFPS